MYQNLNTYSNDEYPTVMQCATYTISQFCHVISVSNISFKLIEPAIPILSNLLSYDDDDEVIIENAVNGFGYLLDIEYNNNKRCKNCWHRFINHF